jgi:uncharacterized integral membrane protein
VTGRCDEGRGLEGVRVAHFVFKTACLSVTCNSPCFLFLLLLRLIAINCFQACVVHFLCHVNRPLTVSHFLYFASPFLLFVMLLRLTASVNHGVGRLSAEG